MYHNKIGPGLIVIDVQEVLDDPQTGPLNNPQAEANIVQLLAHWRNKGWRIFHVRYLSTRKDSPFYITAPGTAIKETVKPMEGEPIVIKHFESAFMRTNLEELLHEANLHSLIFTGFYSDQCVASTVKVANNLGFQVSIVADATATTDCPGFNGKTYKAEDIHQLTLGSLERDGVNILHTGDLLKDNFHA